ncbi:MULTISPECIES: argininosuccinate synthase [Prochlorococcus]|uniref:Argininosuccinate synthase n=1 Tax=Prochlorococcus marinus (strain SARG / CCMP1375 / SS120) TaxID=167539 RepID=ASSY_PROMA|nr:MULTISPECIES: argininosuccinate synthase [Prochlorococcus]Q7V9F8.1 RecName: Full=Argininosuccinate synthase; AltName: Full=Citrulline--aspartate ligase [Prochlorococcus marinus subsp. marinus str. CCMP1375]AAQ00919.1 Argininosuccinate synthase [Prochlorococcus marinus subsp. marinus str. CCMP1375]KGG10468.1 Argininosuccinate synthase [Prochlorococcus marinus str. LG]KGG20225.1 Argininosuccinate synthase [Prochlorococcus marinus str. SS2]KGG23832.1 Argininosuccinate synthase [Prochlorococcus
MGDFQKVVLAYSGGVDTSACIPYLKNEYGVEEIIAFAADLGQGEELEVVRKKALLAGAKESLVDDLIEPFIHDFAFPAIRANALYEGRYPLSTALARPLIASRLVELAREMEAGAVAHGCTGKGNDQVRFDLAISSLAPHLKILTPAREWSMSRQELISYGEKFGIPAPVSKKSPYSIDLNLLGRSIEAGPLEDPFLAPREEVFQITSSIQESPDTPEEIEIQFEAGNPIAINGVTLDPVSIIKKANALAGRHGFGRIDMIENRVVGIKSREIYEAPGLMLLIKCHQEIESITLSADVLRTKVGIERQWADLVYQGFWFSPLKNALDAFIDRTQLDVNGSVKIQLFKGNATIQGRQSYSNSLYLPDIATYSAEDQYDHKSAEGFIYVWGLANRLWASINRDK